MAKLPPPIIRYHLQLSQHRTTVSLDKIVSDFLAIKMGYSPDTLEAHRAVQQKLDSFIAQDRARGSHRLSQYVMGEAILFLVDKKLSERYIDYFIDAVDRRSGKKK